MVQSSDGHCYLRCPVCGLIFLDQSQRLRPEEEKARYLLHRNSPDDAGYCSFLLQLASPLARYVGPGAAGLDYGCGPAPVLSGLLENKGFSAAIYDPFFYPSAEALSQKYQFITLSEVCEHFHFPGKEFELLFSLLEPGGILGIMTLLYQDTINFSRWYYKDDHTHVCFYTLSAFQWIAETWSADIIHHDKRVILLQKQ